MTDDYPTEQDIHEFLDRVEQLCERVNKLQSDHDQWQNKVESYILDIEQLETKNSELNERLQSLKLEFSEFAGRMETRLKRIRDEAEQLQP